jgi:hypothetical protein
VTQPVWLRTVIRGGLKLSGAYLLDDQTVPGAGTKLPSILASQILAIGARCATLPDLDVRSDDEILGYDLDGLPR